MCGFRPLVALEALRRDGRLQLLVPIRGARIGVVPVAVVSGGDGVDGVVVGQEGEQPEGGDGIYGVIGGHGGYQ